MTENKLESLSMNTIILIIGFSLLLLFVVVLSIGTMYSGISGKLHYWEEKGNCYDKLNNKINEVTCDVKRSCSDEM